jgi:hypothetical protein
MFALPWRSLVRAVYNEICNISPARDYVLTSMLLTRNQLCNVSGEVPVIVEKYVEDMFSAKFWMQVIEKKTMNLEDPPQHDYPERMMPVIIHHYSEDSKSFIPDNITHYLRLIMFGCDNLDTKNVIDSLASESVTRTIQSSRQEYLPTGNLFDNELLVFSISRSAVSMATFYSNFLEQTCNGEYALIQVNKEDKTFYHNMLLFRFTCKLLERANAKGIDPIIEGDPECFGFSQENVDNLGSGKCKLSGIDVGEGKKEEGEQNSKGRGI